MRDVIKLYENCRLCPRGCGVDRSGSQRGICRMPAEPVAASAVLHRGEEPPLLGDNGSGAVFFSGCTLGCPFCQNSQISCDDMGGVFGDGDLSGLFLELQSRGAANINLVTATQFAPSVIDAVRIARAAGLGLPVMWNSSGYESVKTVKLLSDTVDIWLPDIKTLDAGLSSRLFGAPEYPKAAAAAVSAMAKQVRQRGGMLIEDQVMKRGIIVRHLVMPGELEASRAVFEWFAENLKDDALISVMVQYTPVNAAGAEIAGPDYIMPERDYDLMLGWLEDCGIEDGFLQAPEAASSEWIPDFSSTNPFPERYSEPVWHWRTGYTAVQNRPGDASDNAHS